MATTSWNPPDTVQVGEPADIGVEICVSENDAKADRQVEVSVAELGLAIMRPTFQSNPEYPGCFTRGVGIFGTASAIDTLDANQVVDAGGGSPAPAVFNEPGTYTLELSGFGVSGVKTHTLTVEGVPFEQSAVSVNCSGSLPAEITVGDEIEVAAEVVNNNSSQAGVVVEFAVGGTSTTKIVNVPATDSAVVSDTFEAASTGDISPTVSKEQVSEGGVAGAPHDPGTPTF